MNLINNLNFLLIQTKYNLYESNKINQLKPYLSNWVDLILETDKNYLCFKDLWTWNNLNPIVLNEYLYGSEQINLNNDKKYVFILITKNSNLNWSNEILNQKNIHIIEKQNPNELMEKISYFLYSNNVYFYEPDNSIIMLE